MLVNKPDEWVRIALQRFQIQLPHERTVEHNESKESIEKIQDTLITLSEQRFPLVMQGLTKLIKSPQYISSFPAIKKSQIGESNIIVLSTIEKCFFKYPDQCSCLEDDVLNKLLPSIIQYVFQTYDFPHAVAVQKLAAKIISHISSFHFSAIFNKVSFRLHQLASVDDGNSDTGYLSLIRYLKLTSSSLMCLLEECRDTFKSLKKSSKLALISSLEKAIWNWIKHNAEEFANVQKSPKKKLSDLCDNFFDILALFAESSKRKAAVWPLQIMLLMLSSDTLKAVASGEKQQDAHLESKREFLEHLKSALSSAKNLSESAAIACVKLCKCATYVQPEDNSVLCFLVLTVMNELKALLFNTSKPFTMTSQNTITVETLMVDCFISSFRINYRNNQHFDVCLAPTAPVMFNVVYVKGLCTIVKQTPLHWWPKLDVIYCKAEKLRELFEWTIEKFKSVDGNHVGIRMSQLYKGKEKRHRDEENCSMKGEKELLLWLVRLYRMDPAFAFSNAQRPSLEIHQSSKQLLLGLVHLILSSHVGKDVSQEASQTLLKLHSIENVQLWNPVDPIYSFWEISSKCIHAIGESLVNHGSKELWLLKYMKKLMCCRDEYIQKHLSDSNFPCHSPAASSARLKLEEVFLQYLWNPDPEAILTALSCLKYLCKEVNIIANTSMDNIVQINLLTSIYTVYEELADLANGINTGRLALQKRIMAVLRNVKMQTIANKQAWDCTYLRWKKLTNALINFPKEEIPGEPAVNKGTLRRRTTRFSSSGKISVDSIEGHINEWNYMTGFLCSLGAVCFKDYPELRRISRSRSVSRKISRQLSVTQEESETVKQFINELLRYSVCTNEYTGKKIRLIIQDLVGQELSSALYSTLFREIRNILDTFFSPTGQALNQDLNTSFIEQIIAIMKHILENKNAVPTDCFKMEIIEPMIISIIRYTRTLPFNSQSLIIKSRICLLVVTLMSHRDEVLFYQEIKFRNQLVEYLSDWVAHASTSEETEVSREITINSRYLDECAMKAISLLLSELPLQPDATDIDIMEGKSELFLKYFTLFLNLLNKCSGGGNDDSDQIKDKRRQKSTIVYHDNLHLCTVSAMSNLLSANIDAGLTHAIGLGYHEDLTTRAIFMEVLMKILNQGTEFDTLAETAIRDRYDRLANLMATMGDKGELPLAMALANVVPSNQQDDLAQVFVTLFDAMNLLYQFLWNILSQEVRGCEGMHVLFRGNTLATKVMTFCFKIFGGNYINSLLEPIIKPLLVPDNVNKGYEIDPTRLNEGEDLEENTKNVIGLAEKFLNRFLASVDDFPSSLQCLCYCIRKVVTQRFRQHKAESVASAIFLRFINPAINSPQMLGIVDQPPPENVRRGLMFLSKILQSMANNVLFTKEKHMEPLNAFVNDNLARTQELFEKISLNRPSMSRNDRDVYSFVSDANILSLHRMLWQSQEKIGLYMAAKGEFKIYGRRAFEKLTTLLAHLGPPDPQKLQLQKMWSGNTGSTDFEDLMARHTETDGADLQEIKNLRIFYQDGISKAGNPVYYFVPRRFKGELMDIQRLIVFVRLTRKPFAGQAWELVCDLTQTTMLNQVKYLTTTKYIVAPLLETLNDLHTMYVYNMNNVVKEYVKNNDRFFGLLKHQGNVVVVDSLAKFNDYITPEELKLPSTTTSLEKDLNVFSAIKVHSKAPVLLKVGPNCVHVQTTEKHKVLGYSFYIKDVFFPHEIEDVSSQSPEDNNLFGLKFKSSARVMFMSNESERFVQAVTHLWKRWQMTQPNTYTATKKILPKDVPGTLLNMALLNLGTRDPSLRLAAYNLLCALTTVFHLKIEERLFEGTGLCIPANNTIFIVGISGNLANREPHLTLEFLRECISGFRKSNHELKHLCLEYMAPWFPNLSRYCKEPSKGTQLKQVNAILEDLINLTIAEKGAMYPSIQAKIWGNIGKVTELVDIVLDSFIKASTTEGLGSVKAEVMADTSVALATANVQVVSSKFINRLLMLIRKTAISPTPRLEEHLMWEDIAILSRYLLMLSFNDSLDVANNLPYLFHIIITLVCMGPLFLRATIHGILINVIQSLSTCTSLELLAETKRLLRLRMSEFSSPKFYLLFGISQVKFAPVRAFQSSYRGKRHMNNVQDSERIAMTSVDTIASALLELVEACTKDIQDCTWLTTWIGLTMEFAFQNNPPLQPRAVVVYGCISKEIADSQIRQLLLVFIKALNEYSDLSLTEAVIMCFTRLLSILDKNSKFHTASFWIAISILQLAESLLYPCGLTLLEQSLLTLESQGVFDKENADQVLLRFRTDARMSWHCKQLDHNIGISFANNFHFALVAYLLKGLHHPSSSTNTRAIRILNLMLNIAGKQKTNHSREKFAVYSETIPYLAALLIVSDEIRSKLRPNNTLSQPRPVKHLSESQSARTPPNSIPVSPVKIVIESPISPGPAQLEETESFHWPMEVENRLLDPGVVNESQSQALLLTILATLVQHTKDDALEKFLFTVLGEASLVFPKVFPVIYSLISSKLSMVLGHSQDIDCLQAVQTIMQSTIKLNFAQKQLGTDYLQSFGFAGFSLFCGPFYEQGELQQETRAQLLLRFAEGVLETCGGVLDDSLRASCTSLAKPGLDNLEQPRRPKQSISASLTSIPDETQRENLVTSVFKRSLSSRRKTHKERKSEKGRVKRSVTQKISNNDLRHVLGHTS